MKKNQLVMGALCSAIIFGGNILLADDRNLSSTGTGNAKTTLDTGVAIEEQGQVNFGTIMRFGKNPAGTIELGEYCRKNISNPEQIIMDSYSCGYVLYQVPKDTNIKDKYAEGILSDGKGHTIKFAPKIVYGTGGPITSGLYAGGAIWARGIGGTLTLTGTEPDGEYSTTNPGGHPYTVTIDY